jgi:hypothetical protein
MKQLKTIQKIAIIIPLIFISGTLVSYFAEKFRGNEDLRWIYVYGKDLALIMWYGAVTWSIVNSILILKDLKTERLKKILWFLLSAATFLYLFIMMTYAMTRNVC